MSGESKDELQSELHRQLDNALKGQPVHPSPWSGNVSTLVGKESPSAKPQRLFIPGNSSSPGTESSQRVGNRQQTPVQSRYQFSTTPSTIVPQGSTQRKRQVTPTSTKTSNRTEEIASVLAMHDHGNPAMAQALMILLDGLRQLDSRVAHLAATTETRFLRLEDTLSRATGEYSCLARRIEVLEHARRADQKCPAVTVAANARSSALLTDENEERTYTKIHQLRSSRDVPKQETFEIADEHQGLDSVKLAQTQEVNLNYQMQVTRSNDTTAQPSQTREESVAEGVIQECARSPSNITAPTKHMALSPILSASAPSRFRHRTVLIGDQLKMGPVSEPADCPIDPTQKNFSEFCNHDDDSALERKLTSELEAIRSRKAARKLNQSKELSLSSTSDQKKSGGQKQQLSLFSSCHAQEKTDPPPSMSALLRQKVQEDERRRNAAKKEDMTGQPHRTSNRNTHSEGSAAVDDPHEFSTATTGTCVSSVAELIALAKITSVPKTAPR